MLPVDCPSSPASGGKQCATFNEALCAFVTMSICMYRYVQLPINAGMTEAWEHRYQVVEVDGTAKQLTFMQAAAQLGVGVFASAALREGALLQDTSLEVQL